MEDFAARIFPLASIVELADLWVLFNILSWELPFKYTEESCFVRVWVFLEGWESALDSVDFIKRDSSLLLDKSFFVTDLYIPDTLTARFAPCAWYVLSQDDFITLVSLLRGIEFLAGVTTVSPVFI